MRYLIVVLLCLLVVCSPAAAAEIPLEVQQALVQEGRAAVIVALKGRVEPQAALPLSRHERRKALVGRLKEAAKSGRDRILTDFPSPMQARVTSLWHINSLALEADRDELVALAAHPDVAEIRLDAVVRRNAMPSASSATIPWNVGVVQAPDLWNLGFDGSGVVVASLDTGVDYLHDDLRSRWRGGSNSWYNPYAAACQLSGTCGVCDENALTPCDYVDVDGMAHGTAVMSVMVAGDATGYALGVAPGAKWIAAKIFKDDDTARLSAIHQAFGWLLDPDDNPLTDDLPDVVNNSWTLSQENLCDNEFLADIQSLRAAGINVVFSAGNGGPAAFSSVSPANNGPALAVGAVDQQLTIADFSSRGPSACGGIYPDLVAPGVSIRVAHYTYDGSITNAYLDGVGGTSFSAPHVAGVLALLRQAFPSASVDALESSLMNTATDLSVAGPDNTYGYGAVAGLAAFQALAVMPSLAVSDSIVPEDDLLVPFGSIVPDSETFADVTLANVGGGDLSINSVGATLASPFFVVTDGCSSQTLPPAADCSFRVRFAPQVVSAYTANLSIVSNAGTRILRLSGAGNHPPSAAELIAPLDDAVLTTTSVRFRWFPGIDPDGGSVTSQLLLSTNSVFSDAQRIEIAAVGGPPSIALASFAGGALLVPLVGLAIFRRGTRRLLVGCSLCLLLGSCGGGGGGGGDADDATPVEESVQVDSLQAGTVYYWQVETTDALGATTASEVRSLLIQ